MVKQFKIFSVSGKVKIRIRDDIAREELKLEEILGLIKKISFSTGIAKIENGKLDEAIKQADQAMYEEKNRKKAARLREEQEKKYADVAEDISVT